MHENKTPDEPHVETGVVPAEHRIPFAEAVGFQTKEEVDRFMEAAERKVDMLQKLKIIALKATKPSDWVDEAGSPYLQATGSEAVAHVFGLSIVNHRAEKVWADDNEGRYYIYKHYAQIGLAGRVMDTQGKCSQRDKFLSMAHGKRIEPDETNVDQKAYSNMLGNGIKRFLGLRNVTWEDLEEVNIARSDVTSVERKTSGKKSGKTGGGKTGKQTEDKPTGTIDEARAELTEIINNLYGEDDTNFQKGVRELSGFTNDKRKFIYKNHISELSRNWLFRTLKKARDELAVLKAREREEREEMEAGEREEMASAEETPPQEQPNKDDDIPF